MVKNESISQIAKIVFDEIEKHFPGLTAKTFDSFGMQEREGSPALERIEAVLYMELLKAGLFKDEN